MTPLELARGALASLEANRQRIDDLNVYPVPDGDTGTNLTLTVARDRRRARDDRVDRPTDAREGGDARRADGRARQLRRDPLPDRARLRRRGRVTPTPFDAAALARAFRGASDAAYRAVRRPVEGTMLTVIRELAEEAERADHSQSTAELLVELVHAGEESLARTQDMLDVLRDAGVVDAGGAGLVEIVRGLAATATGEPIPEAPAARVARLRRDPPGALGVPLLHDVRDRGRRPRCARSSRASSSSSATRCSSSAIPRR